MQTPPVQTGFSNRQFSASFPPLSRRRPQEIPAGAYYWWNPELSPTNEDIMAWNIKIGNCTEIATGCKDIKVYA